MAEARQKKQEKRIRWLKRFFFIAILALLCIWYLTLRIQLTPTASPSQTGSPVLQFPYVLAGNNGEVRYDSNGNLIDTSDYLVSVQNPQQVLPSADLLSFDDLPAYQGRAVIMINNNQPFFTSAEINLAKQGHFEYYGDLDALGRCTVAFDCLGRETMPNGLKRGSISAIRPTGWKQARYDCVDSETVMTRAHLAGYMLSAENANVNNLITGTRYLNSDAMLPYEESTADYLDHHPSGHVLYRVTPYFRGNNLMAEGILMEAMSVEDEGKSHHYCVFVYNVQPGIAFRYETGVSQYTGIFFDVRSGTVVTVGLQLKQYGMDFSANAIHATGCADYAAVPKEKRAVFYGDTTMKNEWADLGYKLHTCVK